MGRMGSGRSVAERWLLARFVLGAGLLGRVVGQDNTQPTAEELACWQEYNGGAYFDPNTNVCAVCVAGRYDHDAIINMPHMNMNMDTGVITWWDGTTDYNPVRAGTIPSLLPALPRVRCSCLGQPCASISLARVPAGCDGMCRL